ncbi:MAG TPA: hypothetical protein VE221_02305 [Sphingomicrobium sp.]|nr:hypothetical protein [Sphingomicrobium sp.]
MQLESSPLVGSSITRIDRRARFLLVIAWLALVAWFLSGHVFWKDEVRAFSLALSGSNVVEMLRNVHGEGHPALWYLILRGAHDLFPYREVLPVAGAVLGIGAMAVFAFWSPFRLFVIALVLFSLFGAFDNVVVARNYGIAALVMFALAALYGRVRNSLWLGVILAILCNTNVPSCLVAAAFLLFRFVEMLTDQSTPTRREWLIFAGNAALAAVGAMLCFVTVYPTFNNAAVSANASELGAANLLAALIDAKKGFSHLIFGPLLLLVSCVGLIRRPAALFAAIAGLLGLKLFFYFVYPSSYRHEALFVVFLLSLYWMTGKGAGGSWLRRPQLDLVQLLGTLAFIGLLAMQTVLLIAPIKFQVAGIPYSRSADVARLLRKPELSGAIVMGDPDTVLEALPYYVDNPLWFLRQQRFGKVVRLSENARRNLSLDDILADAERLHRQTGRPVVFLSVPSIEAGKELRARVMYDDVTFGDRDGVNRFLSSTRLVASLRPSWGNGEDYDVYVYPR